MKRQLTSNICRWSDVGEDSTHFAFSNLRPIWIQSTELFFKSGIFHDWKKSFHHVAVERKSFSKECQQRVQGIKVSTVRRRTDIQRSPWPNRVHNSSKNGLLEMELLKLDPKRKILRTTEMDHGGFRYFLFSPFLKEMIQFDDHIFQMGWLTTTTFRGLLPPARN